MIGPLFVSVAVWNPTYDMRIADLEILISLLFNEMYKDENNQLKIKIYETDQR